MTMLYFYHIPPLLARFTLCNSPKASRFIPDYTGKSRYLHQNPPGRAEEEKEDKTEEKEDANGCPFEGKRLTEGIE